MGNNLQKGNLADETFASEPAEYHQGNVSASQPSEVSPEPPTQFEKKDRC